MVNECDAQGTYRGAYPNGSGRVQQHELNDAIFDSRLCFGNAFDAGG